MIYLHLKEVNLFICYFNRIHKSIKNIFKKDQKIQEGAMDEGPWRPYIEK